MALPSPANLVAQAYYEEDKVYEIMISAAKSGRKSTSIYTSRLSDDIRARLLEQGYGIEASKSIENITFISW
jgi:hypothetical protein